MANVKFIEQFEGITTDDIAAFESSFNIVIPHAYKKFLLEQNGGVPEPSSFSFTHEVAGHINSSIQYFAGIHGGNHHSLARYRQTHGDRMPKDLLPIARDWFGNYICLGISKVHYGKIYFWDHEWETDPLDGDSDTEEDLYVNAFLVANSFNEFIASLGE